MDLTSYIQLLDIESDPVQQEWYERFTTGVRKGQSLFENATPKKQASFKSMFDLWVQTEELKAWYGEPEKGSLFQGTSISSLTIPYELQDPLIINGIEDLENRRQHAAGYNYSKFLVYTRVSTGVHLRSAWRYPFFVNLKTIFYKNILAPPRTIFSNQ